ncbi:hypothetical protein P4H71_27960 [Paenibacillus kribbensis]|uniref:hypothetical protein n=1 Tax=Paenibacillus TaxID=44249 RepID=UPI0002E80DD7|nr:MULTISPECIES: hypothetical protein [Paenibacillus]MEC0238153.1 hypothetical protein [Paenibacillus kribbensis]
MELNVAVNAERLKLKRRDWFKTRLALFYSIQKKGTCLPVSTIRRASAKSKRGD